MVRFGQVITHQRMRHVSSAVAERWRSALAIAIALLVLSSAILSACSAAGGAKEDVDEVRALTGAHTRVVWVQGDGTDPNAEGDQLLLLGYDTEDGRGERVILGERRSYVKPLLTSGGQRIVFTSRVAPDRAEISIVDWDGAHLRRLADGFALAVWQDPRESREWIYASSSDFREVVRYPLDAPHAREIVWNRTMISPDSFQVSADGRHAGGLFPWPVAGLAELPNGDLRQLGDGCWTALAGPRGLVFWYFDGAHRNLTMADVRSGKKWVVPVNSAPGFEGAEAFHPRWASHPRFLAISGPYNQGGDNQVSRGGAQAEIYLGRFSPDYSKVEAWARVSRNEGGDSYPDVWVDRRAPHSARPEGPLGPAAADAERSAGTRPERVVVKVRLTRAAPVPSPRSILPYRHALLVSDYEVLEVLRGQYGRPTMRIAQWVIRDGRVLGDARKEIGSTATLTVEPYEAHGELEGERLISDSMLPDVPLFYEIGRE